LVDEASRSFRLPWIGLEQPVVSDIGEIGIAAPDTGLNGVALRAGIIGELRAQPVCVGQHVLEAAGKLQRDQEGEARIDRVWDFCDGGFMQLNSTLELTGYSKEPAGLQILSDIF